ncbi:GAF domain-containing protein [Friedmanniella luteola]|uniref:GAF domain-containing protein n=1 Tax=Friedmanniella luteola TaxID=546871 RepID=A0A1H1YNI6_9ACTN|nr:GAF domain-containing protein [Friedmanniella luteola]SDT22920.1 GAF domain-containing protein [Friedmanniella luteola]
MTSTESAASGRIQERLRSLVVTNRAIVAELSLDSLLRLVVESARTVVEAQYAVLEVVGPSGELEQFIQSGTDRRLDAPAGDGPAGGLSGVVPGSALPVRRWFPGGAGTAAPEVGVRSLLGVAVGSGGTSSGNLFLANRLGGGPFSAEDESLVTALAATAGIAIENARLYAESHRRQEWLTASAEISQRLLAADVDPDDVLGEIAATVQRLAPADLVSIVVPDPAEPEMLEVAVACGQGSEQLHQMRYRVDGSIAWRSMQAGHGVLARDADDELGGIYTQVRPLIAASDVMALPLRGAEEVQGAIVVVRTAPVPFTALDVEMATGFAGQAALALELAGSRREHQQLAVLEDRARIARDLHDHVVQKLFAVGLTLQGAMRSVHDPVVGDRLGTTVTHLDETIRSIRTSIFELQTPRAATASLRPRLIAVLSELVPVLGFTPTLQVEGPLDSVVREDVAEVLESVLREAVTNIALHAEASSTAVRLVTDGRRLTVTVSDDGDGLPAEIELSGLAGLRERATELGGHLELGPSPEGGLLLTWSIPV